MIHNLTRHINLRQKQFDKNGHHLAHRIPDYLNDHLDVDNVVQDIANDLGYHRCAPSQP